TEVIFKQELSLAMASHGGGDSKLIDAFIESVLTKEVQPLTNALCISKYSYIPFS
ncbi:unnamed protein product, partial [marine sediment metagenome]